MQIFKKAVEFDSMTTHQLKIFLGLFDYDDLKTIAEDNNIPVGASKGEMIANFGIYRERIRRYVAVATVL